jgi:hypothetical protein
MNSKPGPHPGIALKQIHERAKTSRRRLAKASHPSNVRIGVFSTSAISDRVSRQRFVKTLSLSAKRKVFCASEHAISRVGFIDFALF